MLVIYVGDARDVIKRVRSQHCAGNVEASALRKHIAVAKGYPLSTTRRASGSSRVRLALPDPSKGEQEISAYLRTGTWKFAICDSYEEAHDFQWYVIEQLNPLLNVSRKPWGVQHQARYAALFGLLESIPRLDYSQLGEARSGPGVYVLYHEVPPSGAELDDSRLSQQ